jgi:hypothetical protein
MVLTYSTKQTRNVLGLSDVNKDSAHIVGISRMTNL